MRLSAPIWCSTPAVWSETGLDVGPHRVMSFWELPLMREMSRIVTRRGGSVLEIGYGLGLASQMIAGAGITSHVIVECHPQVAERARRWALSQSAHVEVIEDLWQNAVPEMEGQFDGVLFDTYAVDAPGGWLEFLEVAGRLMAPGACLTYHTMQTRDFQHHEELSRLFDHVELTEVGGLPGAPDWPHDHMMVPCLSEPRCLR